MLKQTNKKSKNSVSPLFIPLSLAALLQLLSYPLLSLLPSYVIELVTSSIPNAQYYLKTAYIATVTTFSLLLILILLTGCSRQTKKFQNAPTAKQSLSKSLILVRLCTLFSVFLFLISLYQTNFKIPLLEAAHLNSFEYKVYRQEIEKAISIPALNLSLYLFIPTSILIAFFTEKRHKKQLRALAILQLILTMVFFLAKSKIAIPLIIVTIARTLLKPIRVRMLVVPAVAGLALVSLMAAFSAKDITGATNSTAARVIHGQWLGLPLYLWYYQDEKASPLAYTNPTLLTIAGIDRGTTPGRELMEYLNPAGVEAGTAGNIPTYYIGEAFALAGWPAVFISTLYIYAYIHLTTWSFLQIKKTALTCVLYAIFLYKISYGLTSGLSSFLISSTTFGVLLLTTIALAANSKRKLQKCPQSIPTSS